MIEIHVRHGEATAKYDWGLSSKGEDQARSASDYIHSHFPRKFLLGFHSGSRRAVETSQLLNFPLVAWTTDKRLREADWQGQPEPRKFSTWKEMYDRVASAYKEVDARHANEDRIYSTHGGTIKMARAFREGFTGSKFASLFEEPYKYFTNCQIIIYTNEDPTTGAIRNGRLWVKSVCPWDLDHFGHDWLLAS